jgi:hypothetical protein
MKNILMLGLLGFALSACMSPTKPEVHFASENSIAIKYSAYDIVPTVTAEALDMAIKHCEKHGKGMKLVSSGALNSLTTQELHTFMCTNDFTDERIEVKVN